MSARGQNIPSWEPFIKPKTPFWRSKSSSCLLGSSTWMLPDALNRVDPVLSPRFALLQLSSFQTIYDLAGHWRYFDLFSEWTRELSESLGLRNDTIPLKSDLCWENTVGWKVEAGRLVKKLPWGSRWKDGSSLTGVVMEEVVGSGTFGLSPDYRYLWEEESMVSSWD